MTALRLTAGPRRARLASVLAVVLVAQTALAAPVAGRRAGSADDVARVPAAPLAGSAATGEAAEPAGARNEAAAEPADRGGPGIHYEDALAHAADRIEFKPGGRVEVGFRPRAGDTWSVGGGRPRELPAGRVSGADMAASPQGSRWATPGAASPGGPRLDAGASPAPAATPVPPVDAPSVAPEDIQAADGAAATDVSVSSSDAPAATALSRQVFGFLPYWEVSSSSTVLDYDVLSTIAYFSVGADSAGNLQKRNADGSVTTGWAGWTSSRMTTVINEAHLHGTRVVLTITSFAWTTSQANSQAALLGSSSARLNLARQAAAAVRDRGADGINLDFEPIASGYADEFTALVRTMRAELDAIAPGYQLTFDTTGFIGNYPIEAATAPGGADAIFIMGYDYKTAGSNPVGSIDPVSGPWYDLTETLEAYTARVPASKLILGVPYYGRAWSTDTDKAHATNISGTKYGSSATVVYSGAAGLAAQHGRRWDSLEQSPYVVYRRENCSSTYGCVTSWRQVWYDDAESLRQRYELVNSYGLAGAGIWALGYDDTRTELNRALADSFGYTTTAPAAGIKLLRSVHRDPGFTVAWASNDPTRVVSWDVQVSVDGAPFTDWLTRTTQTSEVFLARTGHGYAFRVRARDASGAVGPWDVSSTWRPSPPLAVGGFGGVRIDGLNRRSAPGTDAAVVGQFNAGQIVSIVGGPVAADGYTWWRVTGPLREWRPVSAVTTGWVAQGTSTTPWLSGWRAPNATWVDAVLRDLAVGATGTTSIADASARIFSPNGDGRRDTLTLRWTNAVDLDSLALKVHRVDGSLVGSVPLGQTSAGAQSFAWNGTVAGARLPDATYALALTAVDGGVTFSAPSTQPVTPAQIAAYGVTIDTRPPAITGATLSNAALSPNDDGVLDTTTARVTATGAAGWGIFVTAQDGAAAGTIVRSTSALGTAATFTWNGRTNTGASVADGRYRYRLWVADAAGNRSERGWDIVVDTRVPSLATSVTPAIFSPNGDGVVDTASIGWTSDEAGTATVTVLSGTNVVRTWTASASPTRWDGRDGAGTAAPNGRYTVRVRFADAAGNGTTRDAAVVVDRTAARLRAEPAQFHPQDRDGYAATSTIAFDLAAQATTTLRIETRDGRYVRTAWRERPQAPGTWRFGWNGLDVNGLMVPPGWYRAVLTVRSAHGTTVLTRLMLADAFRITPSAATLTAGDVLTVTVVSAEPLAAAPRVTFTQAGRTPVTWSATATGTRTYAVRFAVHAGGTGPATISVNGRDAAGGINVSSASVVVR